MGKEDLSRLWGIFFDLHKQVQRSINITVNIWTYQILKSKIELSCNNVNGYKGSKIKELQQDFKSII